MKKIVYIILLSIPWSVLADSRDSKPAGPGVIYHHHIKDAGPWQIHVLEIDLTNQYINIETAKAQDRLAALERTSSMVLRQSTDQHVVVGAINADFYDISGIPIGAQVRNGELLKRPVNRSAFGISEAKVPEIDVYVFQGKITKSKQSVMAVGGINETRYTNSLIIYNNYFGSSTNTNQWGTELIAQLVSYKYQVNDTFYVEIVAKDSTMGAGSGNNSIPANGIVLSGHGTAAATLNDQIFVGDTVGVLLSLLPNRGAIDQLVGGTPRIIRDGKSSVEWAQEGISQSFATDRHPRTAVGISQDSTKLYLFTVDGRQPNFSAGMSLYELAVYMLEWGVYQGVNLDGGGSTTMVVRDSVVNSPSDVGGERSVSNSLMVVSSAPLGPLAHLLISPEEVYILIGSQLQFRIDGFDEFFNPVAVDENEVIWTCDQNIGSISPTGLLTAGAQHDSGYVYAQLGEIRDSTRVFIGKIASITLLPNPVILEVGEVQTISANTRDTFGNIVTLDASQYTWSVSGDVGTISALGIFKATNAGSGQIHAKYQDVTGTTEVKIGLAAENIIDDFSTLDNWTLSGLRIDLQNCSLVTDQTYYKSPPSSAKLNYQLTTGGTSVLYLNCEIPISGSPKAVGLQVYGDGKEHWLRGELKDADGELFLINFTPEATGINWVNRWEYIEVPFSEVIPHWSNGDALLTFPVTWTKIYLAESDEAKKDDGLIRLEDFKAIYITALKRKSGTIPQKFELNQNYPNPFNPRTTIGYDLPQKGQVKLEIFDISGQKIDTLVDQEQTAGRYSLNWSARDQASSIYFYRLSFDSQIIATRKMIVLR